MGTGQECIPFAPRPAPSPTPKTLRDILCGPSPSIFFSENRKGKKVRDETEGTEGQREERSPRVVEVQKHPKIIVPKRLMLSNLYKRPQKLFSFENSFKNTTVNELIFILQRKYLLNHLKIYY